MPAHTHGYVRKSVDESVAAAVRAGRLDKVAHAATITGLRRAAAAIDRQGEDVSAATLTAYLAYCKALGLVPAKGGSDAGEAKGGKIDEFRKASPLFRAV